MARTESRASCGSPARSSERLQYDLIRGGEVFAKRGRPVTA
jgi:hypothetical protein